MEASKQPVHLDLLQQDIHQQAINILPHRDDGASYTGILIFKPTEPVGVEFGHSVFE